MRKCFILLMVLLSTLIVGVAVAQSADWAVTTNGRWTTANASDWQSEMEDIYEEPVTTTLSAVNGYFLQPFNTLEHWKFQCNLDAQFAGAGLNDYEAIQYFQADMREGGNVNGWKIKFRHYDPDLGGIQLARHEITVWHIYGGVEYDQYYLDYPTTAPRAHYKFEFYINWMRFTLYHSGGIDYTDAVYADGHSYQHPELHFDVEEENTSPWHDSISGWRWGESFRSHDTTLDGGGGCPYVSVVSTDGSKTTLGQAVGEINPTPNPLVSFAVPIPSTNLVTIELQEPFYIPSGASVVSTLYLDAKVGGTTHRLSPTSVTHTRYADAYTKLTTERYALDLLNGETLVVQFQLPSGSVSDLTVSALVGLPPLKEANVTYVPSTVYTLLVSYQGLPLLLVAAVIIVYLMRRRWL